MYVCVCMAAHAGVGSSVSTSSVHLLLCHQHYQPTGSRSPPPRVIINFNNKVSTYNIACTLVVCTYTYTQHTVFSSGPLYYFRIHLHVCTCSHIDIIFTHISLLLPSLSDWVTQLETNSLCGAAVDFLGSHISNDDTPSQVQFGLTCH